MKIPIRSGLALLSIGIVASISATTLFAQSAKAQSGGQDALQSEYRALNEEYRKAQEAYYEPLRKAKTDEEASKIQLDPTKDPSKPFLSKFIAFGKKAGKNEIAIDAFSQAIQLAGQLGDEKTCDECVKSTLSNFGQSPKLESFASRVAYSFYGFGPEKMKAKVVAIENQIIATSKLNAVKASALYAKATALKSGNGKVSEAVKLIYDELLLKYADTSYGKNAKGDVFEMEHLVVGKPAPDFEAKDQDDKAFRLSDYRGKVIVLDFWGFW